MIDSIWSRSTQPCSFFVPFLAEGHPLNSMGSHFRKGSENFTSQDLLILLAVVTIVFGTIWVLSRAFYGRERRVQNNPWALFREVCRAHRLNHSQRRLLSDLAKAHNLSHPALVFLEPERFAGPHPSAPLRSRQKELEALADRLFIAG